MSSGQRPVEPSSAAPAAVAAAARELDEQVAGCAAAHQRLLGDVDRLSADDVRAPSLLPGWTVGHVLTHIARNADSFVRVFDAAARGETVERYPGGRVGRAADIDAGAGRPVAELVDDVRTTIWALEGAWARADAPTWQGSGLSLGEREPVIGIPFRRWREVEVHHADLGNPSGSGAGFTFEDWSDGYVRRDLIHAERAWAARRPMGLTSLPPVVLALPPRRRLAWFMGRLDVPGLERPPQWF